MSKKKRHGNRNREMREAEQAGRLKPGEPAEEAEAETPEKDGSEEPELAAKEQEPEESGDTAEEAAEKAAETVEIAVEEILGEVVGEEALQRMSELAEETDPEDPGQGGRKKEETTGKQEGEEDREAASESGEEESKEQGAGSKEEEPGEQGPEPEEGTGKNGSGKESPKRDERRREELKEEELTKEEQKKEAPLKETPEKEAAAVDAPGEGEEERRRREKKEAKRKARHKKRVRTEVAVYLTMLVLILVLAGLVYLLVRTFAGHRPGAGGTADAGTMVDEPENPIEELIGEEDELTEPEPVSEPEADPEPTAAERLDEIVNAAIEVMPIEDKVAGLFLVTPENITGVAAATRAGDATKGALAKYAVGGLVYSAKNIESEAQFRELIETTLLYVNYPTFIAVAEEGGSDKAFSPVTASGIGEVRKSASELAAESSDYEAYEAAASIGGTLAGLGITVDLAPVADIGGMEGSVLAGRTFGASAEESIHYAASFMQGLTEQGIVPCVKYFPSLACAGEDPANGRVSSDRTAEEFREGELAVFASVIENGARMVQVSNVIFPALDETAVPSSLSSAVVTGLLRGELGYDGVVVSGSLSDKAVSEYYGADEAAILALKAGCDILLAPEDFETAYSGVLDAVADGVISEERIDDALRRIYRIKYADKVEE